MIYIPHAVKGLGRTVLLRPPIILQPMFVRRQLEHVPNEGPSRRTRGVCMSFLSIAASYEECDEEQDKRCEDVEC